MHTRTRGRTRLSAVAVPLVAAVVIGACSSSSSAVRTAPVDTSAAATSAPVETSAAPATSAEPGTDGALTSLLSAMPAPTEWGVDPPSQLAFVLADLDAADAAAGLARPDKATATDESVKSWVSGLYGRTSSGGSSRVAMPRLPSGLGSVALQAVTAEKAFGWSMLDVHAYITDYYGTLSVLRVSSEPAWPSGSGTLSTDGVWSLGDRDGTLFSWAPRQPASSTVRLAWRAGLLACSGSTAPAKALLATGRPTLADSPSLVAVTRAVDAMGAVAAVVLEPSVYSLSDFKRYNPRASDAKVQEWAQQPVPNAFDALAIGLSIDGGDRVLTFVYHHVDAAAATAAAPVLESLFRDGKSIKGERMFRDMFTVRSVVVSGDLVTVTVVGAVDPASLAQDHENFTVHR